MSLKSKIEAVIYASEEPVTLPQLTGLLAEEAQTELDQLAALQAQLPLGEAGLGQSSDAGEGFPVRAEAAADSFTDSLNGQGATGTAAVDIAESSTPDPDATTAQAAEQAIQAVPPLDEDRASEAEKRRNRERERAVRDHIRRAVDELIREYAESDRGIEVREVAGGFRMGTKPEYHDAVRGFVKSLKPALKLSLQALETLAVVAYKQPVTAAEISEIRGVDSAGVLGGLMTRKLIAIAGRKQVIGRPMLYKTTKEFLMRFGLKDVQELPSMEEFERMAGELTEQEDLPMESTEAVIERANVRGDAEHLREANAGALEEQSESAVEELSTDDLSTDEPSADPEIAELDVEEFAVERPSEDLVNQVLEVSRDNGAGARPGSATSELVSAPPIVWKGAGVEALTAEETEGHRDREGTEPIEAAAAMQAEQTGNLAKGAATQQSETTESEQR